jgi:DNA invertase Pin-like site-specific DNA recombinase
MRAAIYVRVSTSEQTVEPQLVALHEYAERRGLAVLETYQDEGVSGAKTHRPALDRLLRDARRRRFDLVVVVKLDRLARSVRHLCNITAELEALGVDLAVLDQGIDTSTPSGRLLFHTLAAVAEFERDLIKERTLAGLRAARRRGRRLGRPRAQVDRLELIRGLRRGDSVSALARHLGVARSTVRRFVAEELGVAEKVSPSGAESSVTTRG